MKKNKIGPDSVVLQVEKIVSSDMDGETVMMSIENGKYYGMNEIGSRIWEIIEKPVSVSGLCDRLMDEFEVDREKCRDDVIGFLRELSEDGLIVVEQTKKQSL